LIGRISAKHLQSLKESSNYYFRLYLWM